MNNQLTSFFRTDLREALYMLGFAGLSVIVVSFYSTESDMLIGSAVIGMTLGKLLVRIIGRKP